MAKMAESAPGPVPGPAAESELFRGVGRQSQSAWEKQLRLWHLFFAVVLLFTAWQLINLREGIAAAGGSLPTALAGLALLGVGYATVGVHAARSRHEVAHWAYLGLATVGVFLLGGGGFFALLIAVAVFNHCWLLAESRWQGILSCAAVAIATGLGIWSRHGFAANALAEIGGDVAINLAIAIGMGIWFGHMDAQADRNARLVDQLRQAQATIAAQQHEAGVVAERERMAREIHDTLAQGFASIVVLAQGAAKIIDADTRFLTSEVADAGDICQRLALIETTARQNLAEARALVAANPPAPLERAPLDGALQRLAAAFTEETGLPVDVSIALIKRLDPAAEVVLYRAAQEAFTNIRRHARATRVTMALRPLADGEATLTIADDGLGIAPGTPEGFGLAGMRSRAQTVGGTFHLTAAQPHGTTVRITVPQA